MGTSIWFQLLLQVCMIALNAVFACAEIAVVSFNDAKLARMAAQGDKRAVRLAALTNEPARFLATIQVAITLSGFIGSAYAAQNFAGPLTQALVSTGIPVPESAIAAVAPVLTTLVLSYFTLVFGELVPKRLAMKNAEKLALGMSGMISAIAVACAPLVSLLTFSTNAVLRLLGVDPGADDESVTEEDIQMMVDAGIEKGTIGADERELIRNVFEFDDVGVGELATHRTEMSVLWLKDDEEAWDRYIRAKRHRYYPVCGKNADDIRGILDARDYYQLSSHEREEVLEAAVHPAYFVPDSLRADALFRNMKAQKKFFAVVLDEYGGVVGVVSMQDLLEQLVGDFDTSVPMEEEITQIGSDAWRIGGSASLEKVSDALNRKLPVDAFDTFGGYVFGQLGAVPADGSTLTVESDGLTIHTSIVRGRRLIQALVEVHDARNSNAGT